MQILNFLTILNVVVLAVQANETFFCNSLIQNNLTILPIPGKIHYGITSSFFCASLCSQLEYDCATFDYLSSSQQCSFYNAILPAFLQESDQICQRTNYIPRVIVEVVNEVINTVNINTAETTSDQTCVSSIHNSTRTGSSSCPNFTNCTCNQTLNVSQTLYAGKGDDCFTNCANNPSCLAFSYLMSFCYLATQTSQLTLKTATFAFTCYCQQPKTTSTSVTSGGVTIGGTRYENLSCYPQKVFSGSSYSPKIPMGTFFFH